MENRSTEGILYWITGLSGAGKTTIGNRLYYEIKKQRDNVVLLDGDVLKQIVNDKVEYSEEARRHRAMKYALLCKTLANQGITVICCTIAMFDEVRDWNRKNNKAYVEVFLDVDIEVLKERDQKGLYTKVTSGEISNVLGMDMQVEFPKNPDIHIKNNGALTIKECVDLILSHRVNNSKDFDRDADYWNRFYQKNKGGDIEKPSDFAQYVGECLRPHTSLLELGCGNGRDSLYFKSRGIDVTAIDASPEVIAMLQEKYENENIHFICDDFVCSSMVFAREYDYCYSRFSLHAITESQEKEVVENVFRSLKPGGKFFIEVRSVNDSLCGKGEQVARNAYKYDGHFRRFVVMEELVNRLTETGFAIEYAEEKVGFAKWREENPPIIRIVAERM